MRAKLLITFFAVLLPLTAAAWETGDLRLRGRLQMRLGAEEREYDDGEVDWTDVPPIKRARFDVRWKPADGVRLILEFEGAGLVEFNNQENYGVVMKDAYGRFDVYPALRIHIGHFKKPFSRLKMTSPFALFLPVRGLLNRYAVSRRCSDTTRTDDGRLMSRRACHGGYGGRDVGVMVSGRFRELARLQYYLGVFTGLGIVEGQEESHKDVVGRIQFRLLKGLRLAVNATHKIYFPSPQDLSDLQLTANLFGADLRYKIGKLTLLLEGAFGDDLHAGPGYKLWGAHLTAAYAVSLDDELVLTPAVMAEVLGIEDLDANDLLKDDRAFRLALALNLDVGEICRVILFAEGGIGGLQYWDQNADALDRSVMMRFFVQVNMSF